MGVERNYRGVHWNIPKELYDRIVACHDYSQKRIPGTPDSEETFSFLLLNEAITRLERIQKADQMIIVPMLNLDVSKIKTQ